MKSMLFAAAILGLVGATVGTSYYCFSSASTMTWLKIGVGELQFDDESSDTVPGVPRQSRSTLVTTAPRIAEDEPAIGPATFDHEQPTMVAPPR